jgi:hypothetical protein
LEPSTIARSPQLNFEGQTFPLWCEVTEVWEDIRKADGEDQEVMRIGGIVSTEKLDRQGETVVQEGLNFEPFMQHGFFNDDHKRGTVLGWPTQARMVHKGDSLPSGRSAGATGWWVEGEMVDTKRGREIYEVADSLQRQDAPRRLGFSIEGKIVSQHGGTILKANVAEVAITKKPVNTETQLLTLAKALAAGSVPASDPEAGSGAALQPESLEGAGKRKKKRKKKADMRDQDKGVADWLREIDTMSSSPYGHKQYMKKKYKDDTDHPGYKQYMKAMDYTDDDMADDDDDKKKGKGYKKGVDESVVNDLKKSIDDLASQFDELKKSETAGKPDDPADLFDTQPVNEAKSLDATGLIKSFTGASVQGFRQAHAKMDALTKTVELQADLIKSLGNATLELLESHNAQVAGDAELSKSLVELAKSPVVQRGITNPQQAEALTRQFAKSLGAGGAAALEGGNPFGAEKPAAAAAGAVVDNVPLTRETRVLAKSVRDKIMKIGIEAEKTGDQEMRNATSIAMTQFDRGMAQNRIYLHPKHQTAFEISLTA